MGNFIKRRFQGQTTPPEREPERALRERAVFGNNIEVMFKKPYDDGCY
jgi:hypothetical protein